jgi:signal transduction histidine kinase
MKINSSLPLTDSASGSGVARSQYKIRILYLNQLQGYGQKVAQSLRLGSHLLELDKSYSVSDFQKKVLLSQPDILLLDYDAAGETKQLLGMLHASHAGIPVVLVIDPAIEESAIGALSALVTDYVFVDRPQRLASLISRIVERERLLREAIAQRDRSAREFSNLVETIPVGLAIWNNKRKLVYFNKAFLPLNFDYHTDVQGDNGRIKARIDLYDGDNQPVLLEKQIVSNCLQEGKAIVKENLALKRANGDIFPVGLTAIPLKNHLGTVDSVAVLLNDKCGLNGQTAESPKGMAQSQVTGLKASDLGQFAYIISHNLRDPIAKILGLTQICDTPTPFTKYIVDQIRAQAAALDSIVKDLNVTLSVRNVEREKKRMVSLKNEMDLVTRVLYKEVVESKGVIRTDFSQVPEIFTVKSYLYSVLYNLLSNALKYRSADRPLLVDITATPSSHHVCLVVKDNGTGIDLDKYGDKIFKLYTRFHPQDIPGKGIGLHFVKNYAEALGGTVEIASEPGQGTEVKVYFPNQMNHE